MGWETTRIIRLYPNVGLDEFDIIEFCNHIANSASGLSTHVLWVKNDVEKCFDIKFESSKSSGQLLFDSSLEDIWEIKPFDYGETTISHYVQKKNRYERVYKSIAFFKFDVIRLFGTIDSFDQFLEFTDIKKEKNKDVIHSVGKYTGGNHYQLIPLKQHKSEQVVQVKMSEFLLLRGDNSWIERIELLDSPQINLNKYFEFINRDVFENFFKGLDMIEFHYKSRCVRQIRWRPHKSYENGSWNHQSSDWWDNCTDVNWINFQQKRKSENKV